MFNEDSDTYNTTQEIRNSLHESDSCSDSSAHDCKRNANCSLDNEQNDDDYSSDKAIHKPINIEDNGDESECRSSREEIANCIFVVGGQTDDDTNGGVVLQKITYLNTAEHFLKLNDNVDNGHGIVSQKVASEKRTKLPVPLQPYIKHNFCLSSEQHKQLEHSNATYVANHASLITADDHKQKQNKQTEKILQQKSSSSADLVVDEACEELHSISNDVNRLLELTKQNSELEIKLQKLKRGVAEINQDILNNFTNTNQISKVLTIEQDQQHEDNIGKFIKHNEDISKASLTLQNTDSVTKENEKEENVEKLSSKFSKVETKNKSKTGNLILTTTQSLTKENKNNNENVLNECPTSSSSSLLSSTATKENNGYTKLKYELEKVEIPGMKQTTTNNNIQYKLLRETATSTTTSCKHDVYDSNFNIVFATINENFSSLKRDLIEDFKVNYVRYVNADDDNDNDSIEHVIVADDDDDKCDTVYKNKSQLNNDDESKCEIKANQNKSTHSSYANKINNNDNNITRSNNFNSMSGGNFTIKSFNEQVTKTYGKENQNYQMLNETIASKRNLREQSNKPEPQALNEPCKKNKLTDDGHSSLTTTTNISSASPSPVCTNFTEYFMDSLETTSTANLPFSGTEEMQSQQKSKTNRHCQQQVVEIEEKSNEPSPLLFLQVRKNILCSEINMPSYGKVKRAECASIQAVENEMLNETHGQRGYNDQHLVQSLYYDDIKTSNDYNNLGAIRKRQQQKPQNFIQTVQSSEPSTLNCLNEKQQQKYFNANNKLNNKVEHNKDKKESYYEEYYQNLYEKGDDTLAEVGNNYDNEDDDVFGFNNTNKNDLSNRSQKLLSNTTNENCKQTSEVENASVVSTNSPLVTSTKYRSTHVNNSPNTLSAKYRSLIMITKDQELTERPNESINTTGVNSENYTEKSDSYKSENVNKNNDDDNNQIISANSVITSENTNQMHTIKTNSIVYNKNNDDSSVIAQLKISSHHIDKTSAENEIAKDTENTSTSLLSVDLLRDQRITNNDDDDYDSYEEYAANSNVTVRKCTKIPPIILEDGLADDDSWVEELSEHDDGVDDVRVEGMAEEEDDTTPTCTDSEDGEDSNSLGIFHDREEELRGYNRTAIDFTLHTIVEESCEESEVASLRSQTDEELDDLERRRQRTLQHHHRLSASELEKYFFFGLGDGKVMSSIDTHEDTASEVSSVCSDGLDSLGIPDEPMNDVNQAADLASSRLEKYFILMGFNSTEKNDSDESGSVGSDSEGHPSPSQRRKRLVRARTTPRSHNSSLDNLLVDSQNADGSDNILMPSSAQDIIDSSESENCDETVIQNSSASERTSDSADTMKRKKQLRKRHDSLDEKKLHDTSFEENTKNSLECRTPTPGSMNNSHGKKQQYHSRDSGFIGSNDDLLKSPEGDTASSTHYTRTKSPNTLEQIKEDNEKTLLPIPALRISTTKDTVKPTPDPENNSLLTPASSSNSNLIRKDSFNNWSSDEETNLMMSKMRQFFKTLVVATANAQQCSANNSKSTTPNQTTPISVRRMKTRPTTFSYFENELTRLMKTVPGINEEQVREIVEYLSSEDTWSDSYDSSDYTSSDLEGSSQRRNELKQQISASCQQIINKFEVDEEGDRGDGGLVDDPRTSNQDTALVYQKLVASFSKMAVNNVSVNLQPQNENITSAADSDNVCDISKCAAAVISTVEDDNISTGSTHSNERSPQLFAKVMQHIGTRLVALMHEVSSGNDTHGTNSPIPSQRNQHKRLQAKISATTTEDEEDALVDDKSFSYVRSSQHLHPSQAQHIYHGTRSNIYSQDDAHNLARSKSHDLLLDSTISATASSSNTTGSGSSNIHHAAVHNRPHHHQSSSGVNDTAGEECGVASDYERFSWRGSFESALLANGDSRTKLSQLDRDNSSSASALAVAKRRSAGDLLFNHKSLSREQLDRVRSCGSIGGGDEHHHVLESSPSKPWLSSTDSKDARRSSVPDAIYETDTSSSDDCDGFAGIRSTLPRSLIGITQMSTTNSLPRLPTTANQTTTTSASLGMSSSASTSSTSALASAVSATSTPISSKSQNSLNLSTTNSAKSARYRPPGLKTHHNFGSINVKKCAQSNAQSLQQFLYPKRDARKRLNMSTEEAKAAAEELSRSPVMGQRNTNDPTSSPIQSRVSVSSDNWPTQSDEDIDRWVAMHQNRGSFSSLGPRSDSMASVYSGAGEGRYGTVVVKGQVEFGMQYNYKLGALEIHVVRCKDLAAVDTKRNRSDPYVKVYLLPDKSKAGKRKTKVKKHTLNPIFDEVLRFHMPISNLESRTLWLTVWHSDMFGRNDFLGEVNVNLQGRVFDNPQSQWYLLQERSEPFDEVATYRGDIVVGLKYVTPEGSKSKFMRAASLATGGGLRKFGSIKSKTDRSAKGGQLHVLVKEAKHLTPIKPNGTCDAFCKSYLLPDRTRSSKQKTPIVKRSTYPSWNYTFIYEDVSLEDLSERALELTVWDHDRLASNEFLGGVRFSLGTCKSYGRQVDWMDASGKELSLWQNMLDRPNFWVEGSVILRSSLDGIRAIP